LAVLLLPADAGPVAEMLPSLSGVDSMIHPTILHTSTPNSATLVATKIVWDGPKAPLDFYGIQTTMRPVLENCEFICSSRTPGFGALRRLQELSNAIENATVPRSIQYR
jgi:hypothetical protein